jgi:hypothetical protein
VALPKRLFVALTFTLFAAAACADASPPSADTGPQAHSPVQAAPNATASSIPKLSPKSSVAPPAVVPPVVAVPVAAPVTQPYAAATAAGATAVCADGTWSYSKHRSGTCSGHGGVHWWTGNLGAAGPGAH